MSDDKPTTPAPGEPEETRALPAPDETQALPPADETQALPPADETQAFPAAEGTRALPVAGADDPLSVFDRPDRPGLSDEASARPSLAAPDPLPAPVHEPLPAQAQEHAQDDRSTPGTGPRASTIVWGFLVVAFGVGLLANVAGAQIDVELAAIVLLAAAGVLLVVGSVVSAVRRRRRAPATH
jgi:hypothetical protein